MGLPGAAPGRLPRGGLRRRIMVMVSVLGAAVMLLAGAATYCLREVDELGRRSRAARGQLAANMELSASANRYAEQIAEYLVLGDEELAEFIEARSEVETAFARVGEAIAVAAGGGAEEDGPRDDRSSQRLLLQRGTYLEIDRAVERILLLRGAGRVDRAVERFRNEVENRLDRELDSSIGEALRENLAEVAAAEAAGARQRRFARIAILLSGAAALLGILLLGRSLGRALIRPVLELTEATEALASGNLGRRIPRARWQGELGVLAARFNAMAARIEEQHRHLATARDEATAEMRARTAELRDANLDLQQVDEARLRFLADLSHELRTPLTVMRGEAEVALRSGPEGQREALEVVSRQVAHMDRLVADLLFLARSEAAESRLVARPICLQEVLAEAMEESTSLARGTGIEVEPEGWPEERVEVSADAQRLRQAALIGLDNAIKYSARPGVVSVGLEAEGRTGQVVIRIRNGGRGLSEGEIPHVFERFYRGRNARSLAAEGSGLGLAIARSIVERHGGTIVLRSAPAGPTELCIALPVLASRGEADAQGVAGRGRPQDHELRAAGA